MTETRTIVVRLVGGDLEGGWLATRGLGAPQFLSYQGETTTLVPTGSVEWAGDSAAEVWVPEDRLAEWQAEWQEDW